MLAKVKLSEVVAEKIKEMIEHKEYDSNGFLPSEGELAARYEVSRVTVREAVGIMEARGLVKRIHGKGIQVANNSSEVLTRSLEDMISQEKDILDELLEVRNMIEPEGAKIAADRRSDESLSKLRGYVELMEQSKNMDDAYYEADLAFHIELAKASGNRIHSSFIEAYTPVLRQLIIVSSKAETPIEQKCHYHRNILNAVEQKDGQAAFKEMKKHLEATRINKFFHE